MPSLQVLFETCQQGIEATIAGQTIADYQPGGPSHQEFQALSKYVLRYLRKYVK